MPADLLAKRPALMGVLERRVQARLGETHRSRGHRVSTLVDGAHRDGEALALLADPMLERHPHPVERDGPGVARMDA